MEKKKPGRKSKKPFKEDFEKMYLVSTASELASFYGVSVQTIYQWAMQFRKEEENSS